MAAKDRAFEFTERWAQLGPLMNLSPEVIELLDRRDRDIEDYLSQRPIIFDHDAGAPLRSKPWTAKTFGEVRGWNVELGQNEAGANIVLGAAWTLKLHFDGAEVASLTLPAGAAYVEHAGPLPTIPKGTRITMYTPTVAAFDFVSTVWL